MDAAHSHWHDRPVLVTGCTGFLGGAVTRELILRGAKVIGLVRNRTRAAEFAREIAAGQILVVHGRTEDTARLHSTMVIHEVSSIFHLADSDSGLASVLRAASLYRASVPVIAARPTSSFRIATGNPNSSTLFGITRFGELFGPRDRKHSRAVPSSILSLLAGEHPKPMSGPARDFVFIRDAARACLLMAEAVHRAGHMLDCTFRSGWEFTDSSMTQMLSDVLAGHEPARRADEPSNPHSWRPESPLMDVIRETVEWYRPSARSSHSQSTSSNRQAA